MQHHRYIFVGGLHRSGTSLVARLIAAAPGVGAIAGAPVPEQEGVYLQGGIPHTARHGIPGAFAFDPEQYLTEDSGFNTLEVQRRIESDWSRWYPADCVARVEKSPVNLLRARLYQQLFPTAAFVFVVRHPAAVSLATRKWTNASVDRLVAHWDQAHRLMLEDLPFLHRYIVLRYEDLAADPERSCARLSRFLDLEVAVPPGERIDNRNSDYPLADAPVAQMTGALGYDGEPPRFAGCAHPYRSVAAECGWPISPPSPAA